jgi:uncharacterized protein YoaH (UPF0181 family)
VMSTGMSGRTAIMLMCMLMRRKKYHKWMIDQR